MLITSKYSGLPYTTTEEGQILEAILYLKDYDVMVTMQSLGHDSNRAKRYTRNASIQFVSTFLEHCCAEKPRVSTALESFTPAIIRSLSSY